jgi:3-hydroxyisobutyrate dehydrogenase-like beta-hydroxyacid dehydrogenase
MKTKNSFKVSVIGTGRMGSALATALFKAGFSTTVWNRTSTKTEPLARLGLHVAPSLKAAVDAADVVIFNVSDYATSLELLKDREVASAFSGKILVQLTTGIPQDARQMDSWARQNNISYLDGAIMAYPSGIGAPECTVLYSGPADLFDRVKPVLLAFGGNAVLVGAEIRHASALDLAALNFTTGAMLGFLQGYVVCEAERLSAGVFAQTVKDLCRFSKGFCSNFSPSFRKKITSARKQQSKPGVRSQWNCSNGRKKNGWTQASPALTMSCSKERYVRVKVRPISRISMRS